jgi:hyperosmotically inducible periplasmic protein
MKRQLNTIILIAMITVFLAPLACQTPAGRSAGEVVDDSAITTKVKAKLFADKLLSGFAISVDTFKGEVTLTGAVKGSELIQHVTAIALSVKGVKKVNNLLSVK